MTDYGVWDDVDTGNFFKFFKALTNFLKNPASSELRQEVLCLGKAVGSIGEYSFPITVSNGLEERLGRLLEKDKQEWGKWLWSVWGWKKITGELRLLSPFAGKKLIFAKTRRYGKKPRDFHLEAHSKDFPKAMFKKWEKRLEGMMIFDSKHQKWLIVVSGINQLEETILLER